ncbi:MAG: hypothetical protein IJ867_04355 [Clostridia bacterium]|nr:hypothetical protein [Clostridia bacterium]
MRNLENELKNREIDYSKLAKYGFCEKNGIYTYQKTICKNQFEVIIIFSEKQKVSKVMDLAGGDEYFLVDVQDSTGEFVGTVRSEYEAILNEIIGSCTTLNVFKSKQSHEIIEYVKKKYNDNLEFLWEKFDENAIWRNKLNQKWYGALLKVTEDKLKLSSNKEIEILDLRYQKEETEKIIDNKKSSQATI